MHCMDGGVARHYVASVASNHDSFSTVKREMARARRRRVEWGGDGGGVEGGWGVFGGVLPGGPPQSARRFDADPRGTALGCGAAALQEVWQRMQAEHLDAHHVPSSAKLAIGISGVECLVSRA